MFLSVGGEGGNDLFLWPKDSKKSKIKKISPPPFVTPWKIFAPPFDFRNTTKAIKTLENIEFWWFEIKIFLVS